MITAYVWMCFLCMLKLGVLKERVENESKQKCVKCESLSLIHI